VEEIAARRIYPMNGPAAEPTKEREKIHAL
jgi:hypothetical protein